MPNCLSNDHLLIESSFFDTNYKKTFFLLGKSKFFSSTSPFLGFRSPSPSTSNDSNNNSKPPRPRPNNLPLIPRIEVNQFVDDFDMEPLETMSPCDFLAPLRQDESVFFVGSMEDATGRDASGWVKINTF